MMSNQPTKTKHRAGERDRILGRNLRIFRELRGMMQMQLAEQLDITFQQLQKYEKGTNRITASRLFDLARLLKMQIADFYIDVR